MSSTPHDALFKAIFSQPLQAAEALQHALPPEVACHIDFSTLVLEPGSFDPVVADIDEALRARYTDLLYSVRYAGAPVQLYLLYEHMSTPEPAMPLRLLDTMVDIWKAWLAGASRSQWFPVIIPTVLHHSDLGWRAQTRFEALFDPELPEPLRQYIPKFCFALDDLSHVDDEALLGRAMSAVSRLALSALKHARSAEDLLAFAPAWAALVHSVVHEPNGARALQLVFRYLCQVRGPGELPVLHQIATSGADEATMQTIADMFEERGWEKGLREGRQEGRQEGERSVLLRLLRRRFGELPAAVLARIAAADVDSLERWSEQFVDARTLEEVFAG